jgi:hypothetical protein
VVYDTSLENSFVVPDAALADLPASLRGPAGPTEASFIVSTPTRARLPVMLTLWEASS